MFNVCYCSGTAGPELRGGKLCESCSWAQQWHSDPGAVSCPMGSGLEAVTKDTVLWGFWFRVVKTLVEPYRAVLTFAISCVDVSS